MSEIARITVEVGNTVATYEVRDLMLETRAEESVFDPFSVQFLHPQPRMFFRVEGELIKGVIRDFDKMET